MIEIPITGLEICIGIFLALFGFVWAPKTWTPGELVTASSMNTNIRDHLNEGLRTQQTTLTGTQNDFALDGPFAWVKCNQGSALTLTGVLIDGGNVDGAKVIFEAVNNPVIFSNQDTGSPTSSRLICPAFSDLTLQIDERALLVYDGATFRWRVNRADAKQLQQALVDITAAEADINTIENTQATNARVFHSVNQSINDTTFTALAFDSERFDPASLHSTSVNNSRLTIGLTGRYLVGGSIVFPNNTTGERLLEIREGGSIVHAREFVPATTGSAETAISIATLIEISLTDYLELVTWQSSGGALNVEAQPERSAEFWIHRVD